LFRSHNSRAERCARHLVLRRTAMACCSSGWAYMQLNPDGSVRNLDGYAEVTRSYGERRG